MLATLALLLPIAQAPEPPRFPDFPDQDALVYHPVIEVDLDKREIKGHVRYSIRAVERLTAVRFHARRGPGYAVSFAQGDRALDATWEKDTVTVTLPEPAEKGTVLELRADLAGRPVDGFYFKANRNGEMLAFTDHYSIRARGWMPCEDHPIDRAKWRADVTFKAGNEVVCFGQQVGAAEAVREGWQQSRFAAEAEVPPYMFALVVGPFARVPEAGDPRIVPHFVYHADVERAKKSLVHHAAWLAKMTETFGPYPYAKYTTVQCPTRWGGFEAPGNVQLSEQLFDSGGVGTLAHELVHMWFGDGVGYARWREVWLSEGFASYFGPWLHAQAGGPTMRDSMRSMRERWQRSFESRTKTVRDDKFPHPDQALNTNTYPKGAWILHMLRGEVGDELFFKALSSYYRQSKGQSVVTADFVRIVEAETKTELRWFFDQWLDRVDCPHLKVEAAGDGELAIEQVHKGAPYRFWLRLGWRGADGGVQTRRVRVEARRTTVPGRMDGLLIDPEVELLYRRG